MKTTLTILFLLISVAAYAAINTSFPLLIEKRTTGAGAAQDVRYAHDSWGCDVITFANMSSAVVRIEGNQGGSAFDPAGMATHTMTAAQIAAGIGSFEIVDHTVKKIRANVISLSGGADPRVSVTCTGRD